MFKHWIGSKNLRFEGAGSRNVNKLLSKRRFGSIFDRP